MTALTTDAAIGLPPFVPSTVMYGTLSFFAKSSLESAAPTKPTGMPTMAAGERRRRVAYGDDCTIESLAEGTHGSH